MSAFRIFPEKDEIFHLTKQENLPMANLSSSADTVIIE
jgi:hypothetical protein